MIRRPLFSVLRPLLLAAATAVLSGARGAEDASSGPERERDMDRAMRSMVIPRAAPARGAGGDVVSSPLQARAVAALEMAQEGQDLILDGEREEGLATLNKAIPEMEAVFQADPGMQAVWATLGWCYWLVDRKEDAEKFWRRLTALDPDNARAHELLGGALLARKNLDGAVVELRRAAELDASLLEARLKLGLALRWQGNYTESAALLRALRKEQPARKDFQDELAVTLYFKGDYAEAAPLLAEARTRMVQSPELLLYEARAQLEAGNIESAEILANQMLEKEPGNVFALLLRAEVRQIHGRLPEAAADLQKVLDLADVQPAPEAPEAAAPAGADPSRITPEEEARAARPLVRILRLLWEDSHKSALINQAMPVIERMQKRWPRDADWHLLEGEMALLTRHYGDAEAAFTRVIDEMNPQNTRALRGMYELALAKGRMVQANDWRMKIEALNPKDSYHHVAAARFELARGNIPSAYRYADLLERAGTRGAVAVLLYHDLRKTDTIDSISEDSFRAQMRGLLDAGFRFVKIDEVPRMMRDSGARRIDPKTGVPERIVAVCLDFPAAESLRLADGVADDLDIVVSTFLPAATAGNEDARQAGWSLLEELRANGRWGFGVIPGLETKPVLDAAGQPVHPVSNRLPRPDGVVETPDEFALRLRDTYRDDRQALKSRLANTTLNACLYPLGDIGQSSASNEPGAVPANLRAAGQSFEFGLLPSNFGYAITGDDPMWCHYLTPLGAWTGEEVARIVLENHPLQLARLLRLQAATLDGRYQRARDTLKLLADTGYPESSVTLAKFWMKDRLVPMGTTIVSKLPIDRQQEVLRFNRAMLTPTVEARYSTQRTSIEDDNHETSVAGSIKPLHFMRLKASAGTGEWSQDLKKEVRGPEGLRRETAGVYDVDMDYAGLEASFALVPPRLGWNPLELRAEWLRREFSGDSDLSVDRTAAELGLHIVLPVYLALKMEHDVVPSARSVVEGTTYDLLSASAYAEIRDGWLFQGNYSDYDMSDDNRRWNATARSMVELWEDAGVWIGGHIGGVDAEEARDEYWTPYQYREYGLVLQWRRRFPNMAFDCWALAGRGRGDVRPEDTAAYEALRAQAARQRWLDQLGPAPEEDWEPILTLQGQWMFNLNKLLDGWIQIRRTEVPSYDERNFSAGLQYKFF